MTNHHEETDRNTSDSRISEMELARLVRDLPSGMEPDRDLWAGVQRQILDHPQKFKEPGQSSWMPYAVAASLLVAVSALMLNIVQFQTGQPGGYRDVAMEQMPLNQLRSEYTQVRNPMVDEFTRVNQGLDQKTLEELYRNFQIMEQARLELEQQIRENPENLRLLEMLQKVHEQELELLRQDFSSPSKSM